MSEKINEQEMDLMRKAAKEAHDRSLKVLGDERLVSLAVGVEETLSRVVLHTSMVLGRLIGREKAEQVVLVALREAAVSFEASIAFADREERRSRS